MPDAQQQVARPLWVRCVARDGTKRTAARNQVRIYVMLMLCGLGWACVGLFHKIIPVETDFFLIANRLPFGLTMACLGAAGAIWCWLAVRWVDRNGEWAEALAAPPKRG
jgi:hypothetical protein